jgi:hypothetical protein
MRRAILFIGAIVVIIMVVGLSLLLNKITKKQRITCESPKVEVAKKKKHKNENKHLKIYGIPPNYIMKDFNHSELQQPISPPHEFPIEIPIEFPPLPQFPGIEIQEDEIIQHIINAPLFRMITKQEPIKMKDIVKAPVKVKVLADAQNTHDSAINRSSLSLLEEMRTEIQPYDANETEKEILSYIKGKNKVKTAYDRIKNRNGSVGLFSSRETDVLFDVWEYIKTKSNAEDLKVAFTENLADCIPHDNTGSLYCIMGCVNRLIQVASMGGSGKQIVPLFIIKQEMNNTAHAIVKKMMEEAPNEILNDVEMSLPATIEYDKKIKDTIRKTLYNDYVTTGKITKQTFDLETSWIDFL